MEKNNNRMANPSEWVYFFSSWFREGQSGGSIVKEKRANKSCPALSSYHNTRPAQGQGAMALPRYQSQTQIFSVDIIKPLLGHCIIFNLQFKRCGSWFVLGGGGLSRYEIENPNPFLKNMDPDHFRSVSETIISEKQNVANLSNVQLLLNSIPAQPNYFLFLLLNLCCIH